MKSFTRFPWVEARQGDSANFRKPSLARSKRQQIGVFLNAAHFKPNFAKMIGHFKLLTPFIK